MNDEEDFELEDPEDEEKEEGFDAADLEDDYSYIRGVEADCDRYLNWLYK